MSRFGKLFQAPAPAESTAPEPVVEPTPPAEVVASEPEEVVGSPIVDEDTTDYEEAIEEEIVESYESDVSIDDMSKDELEEYGRTVGIELDRRHTRRKMLRELKEYLGNS